MNRALKTVSLTLIASLLMSSCSYEIRADRPAPIIPVSVPLPLKIGITGPAVTPENLRRTASLAAGAGMELAAFTASLQAAVPYGAQQNHASDSQLAKALRRANLFREVRYPCPEDSPACGDVDFLLSHENNFETRADPYAGLKMVPVFIGLITVVGDALILPFIKFNTRHIATGQMVVKDRDGRIIKQYDEKMEVTTTYNFYSDDAPMAAASIARQGLITKFVAGLVKDKAFFARGTDAEPEIAEAAVSKGKSEAQESWPDLSRAPKAIGGGENDAAVIVGAERYAFVEEVPGARQNAEDWHAYLTETLKVPFDKVALLRDNDATLEEIRQAVADKSAEVNPGGTLWFVFIGHGAPSKEGKDGLLVGVDAQQKAESLYARSLSRGELFSLLSKGRQAKTVVLLDACFSGRTPSGQALAKGLQPLILTNTMPHAIDGRTVILTAARSDQFAGSLPNAGWPRPAFSYLALGALRGWAADAEGKVTASGLVQFAAKALELAHDRTQTPELSAGGADTVLGQGRESGPDLAKISRRR